MTKKRARDRPESWEEFRNAFDSPLDREISYAVKVLRDDGIDTYESCSGGSGHIFSDPTIRFFGGADVGLRAVAVALSHGLPVFQLRRFWRVEDAQLVGPDWEITFFPPEKLRKIQEWAEGREKPGPRRGRA